jgi:hypothetical protein
LIIEREERKSKTLQSRKQEREKKYEKIEVLSSVGRRETTQIACGGRSSEA